MRRAFTLIELLVVIAIIAILASILFPVFAQAKAAAKQSVAVSNQKQISSALLLYIGDYDDKYPRNDDCIAGSSLNPALKSRPFYPRGVGCTAPPYYNRVNHYSWQKWVMSYMKNVDILEHPGRKKFDDAEVCSNRFRCWSDHGQVMGGYALNSSLTGQLNTYSDPNGGMAFRESWLGGSATSVPRPSEAMLLLEFGHPIISFVPVALPQSDTGRNRVTIYPPAWRHVWKRTWFKWEGFPGDCSNNNNYVGTESDPTVTFRGGIVVGFCDGSAKFVKATRLIQQMPTQVEYRAMATSNPCGFGLNNSYGTTYFVNTPNVDVEYPLWGLGG